MTVVACEGKSSTSLTYTDELSTAVNVSASGTANFACLKSGRNPCYFLAYTNTCVDSAGANGKPAIVCTAQLLDQFTLAAGESKDISGAAKVRHCVSNQAPPEFSKCAGADTGGN